MNGSNIISSRFIAIATTFWLDLVNHSMAYHHRCANIHRKEHGLLLLVMFCVVSFRFQFACNVVHCHVCVCVLFFLSWTIIRLLHCFRCCFLCYNVIIILFWTILMFMAMVSVLMPCDTPFHCSICCTTLSNWHKNNLCIFIDYLQLLFLRCFFLLRLLLWLLLLSHSMIHFRMDFNEMINLIHHDDLFRSAEVIIKWMIKNQTDEWGSDKTRNIFGAHAHLHNVLTI